MRRKLLQEAGGQRTFAIVMQTGDEAISCLQTLLSQSAIRFLVARVERSGTRGHLRVSGISRCIQPAPLLVDTMECSCPTAATTINGEMGYGKLRPPLADFGQTRAR